MEAVLAVLGSGIHVPWKRVATEGVRGWVATPPRGRKNRRKKGSAVSEDPLIRVHRSETGQAARETGRPTRDEAEAGDLVVKRAPLDRVSDTASAGPGAAEAVTRAKAAGGGDSRIERSESGTRVVSRLQKSGKRIFRAVARHAERRAERRRGSLMRRLCPLRG